jgi:GH25 family lysozyme M1 (1,4-beta-N-acetylmuramidase)
MKLFRGHPSPWQEFIQECDVRISSPNFFLTFEVGVLLVAGVLSLGMTAPANAASRNLGVDVSHYQGASGISQSSWNQMFADGQRFAYIKATEGLTGPDDAAMANNVARATAAGVLMGVYHYAHPENRPAPAGAAQEADHFLSYSGSAIGPGYLRPVLDLEGNSSTLSTVALTDWVIAFHDRIVEQRGAGAAPIVYTSRSFARYELDNRVANYDLWLAYPTNVDATLSEPPPTASYPDPTGVFNNWSFWQYSWTGSSGGISPLDLDACHDEFKPLASFIIPTPSPAFTLNAALAGGTFRLSFTNTAGTRFSVLAGGDAALPLKNWTVLGAAIEGPAGTFQFTESIVANQTHRFFRVRTP